MCDGDGKCMTICNVFYVCTNLHEEKSKYKFCKLECNHNCTLIQCVSCNTFFPKYLTNNEICKECFKIKN